jgi:hypothetical protein
MSLGTSIAWPSKKFVLVNWTPSVPSRLEVQVVLRTSTSY